MSLSRILNDHPAPASVPPPPAPQLLQQRPTAYHSFLLTMNAPHPPLFPRPRTPISRQAQSSPVLERHTPMIFLPGPVATMTLGAWEDVGEWRQPSRSRNGNMEAQREASPSSVQEYKYGKNDESNAVHKKWEEGG